MSWPAPSPPRFAEGGGGGGCLNGSGSVPMYFRVYILV